ncbi:MAG: alpha/beta fold hydrolase [Candidatus Binataceae bacterium]
MKRARRWVSTLVIAIGVAATVFASGTADSQFNQVLSDLRDGKFSDVTARLDGAGKAAVSPQRLETVWNSMTPGYGKLVGWDTVQTSDTGGSAARLYRLRFEHGQTLLTTIALNESSGEVTTLRFRPDTPAPAATSPPYADANKFYSEDVTVGKTPFELPGILTIPTGGKGPFPAVVLLSGSGPNDKDETIGPNHPLKDIAEGLSSRGIVVLRYDKRTHVYAKQMDLQHVTIKDEYLDDAEAAISLLRSRPQVAKDHIFIAGHSLGATIAPEVALRAAPVQGIIMLAPSGRKFGQSVVQQMRFLGEASHQQLDELERKANELDNHLMPPTENFMGAPASYFYDLDARNEVAVARQLGTPILILHGGRDYQVIDKDIEHWQEGLKGIAHVRVETFPALNHFFIAGTGKPNNAEYMTPGHVDEQVVGAMATFIENPLSN